MHSKINKIDKTKWQRWFAWYPVVTEDGYDVWFEWIWRRLEYSTYDTWHYYHFEKPAENDPYGA